MKAGELEAILAATARMHRDAGNSSTAEAIDDIGTLFDGRETMQVSAFAALIAQTAASELGSSATSGLLDRLGNLFGKS